MPDDVVVIPDHGFAPSVTLKREWGMRILSASSGGFLFATILLLVWHPLYMYIVAGPVLLCVWILLTPFMSGRENLIRTPHGVFAFAMAGAYFVAGAIRAELGIWGAVLNIGAAVIAGTLAVYITSAPGRVLPARRITRRS